MEKKLIEVGDVIYAKQSNGKIIGVSAVIRITDTQAVTKYQKFKREINNGQVKVVGASVYSRVDYLVATEELREEWYVQKTIEVLQNFDYSKLPIETLTRLRAIIETPEQTG